MRSNLFIAVARLAARLPRFRGKNRAFLLLYGALGLKSSHIHVEAVLREPLPYKVRLDLHSWLQRLAFLSGEYEADTVKFLLRLRESMGGSGSLLDIGANIGLIAIPAALRIGGRGPAVIAVEAVAANAAAILRNVALNGAENLVRVVQTALGEIAGTVDIQVEGNLRHGEGTGTANILAKGSTYQCERISLQVRTLDSLVETGEVPASCSVVKIDTDGYDLKVLQGGVRFLEGCRPVIYGEFAAGCLAWHRQSILDVTEFAASLEYEVWQRAGHGLAGFSRNTTPQTFQQDLLLVPKERAQAFEWALRP